ncbi:hypothetical protein PGTUg99_000447 [Puccinia graminis f. sp. tritici]|uniref:Uncharacterized protein n=1 Tax=Puccinia graminis f. sp. tritici TaxID=56615 RepID=A0A5B0P8E2_PUCGR|nr:hypothetical protein PGTUg99_000447 [Puccinia graminis f. sp. tritici]
MVTSSKQTPALRVRFATATHIPLSTVKSTCLNVIAVTSLVLLYAIPSGAVELPWEHKCASPKLELSTGPLHEEFCYSSPLCHASIPAKFMYPACKIMRGTWPTPYGSISVARDMADYATGACVRGIAAAARLRALSFRIIKPLQCNAAWPL